MAAIAKSIEKTRADSLRRNRNPAPGASSRSRRKPSDIELFDLSGSLHDELEARAHVLAQQVVDGLFGEQRLIFGNGDSQRHAPGRIKRGGLERVRVHFAQAFEAHDVGLGVALAMLFQDAVTIRVVQRPVDILADLDLVERWLGNEDVSLPDEIAHVPVEEGE